MRMKAPAHSETWRSSGSPDRHVGMCWCYLNTTVKANGKDIRYWTNVFNGLFPQIFAIAEFPAHKGLDNLVRVFPSETCSAGNTIVWLVGSDSNGTRIAHDHNHILHDTH